MLKRIIGSLAHRLTTLKIRLHVIKCRSTFGSFGAGSKIYPLAVAYVPNLINIGKNVTINDFVHIWGGGGVVIGDGSMIASGAKIVSQTHDTNAYLNGHEYRETIIAKNVTIGRNVWIGSNACILPGIVIGDNAIIAAGAVVTKNVVGNTIVGGIPARTLRKIP